MWERYARHMLLAYALGVSAGHHKVLAGGERRL